MQKLTKRIVVDIDYTNSPKYENVFPTNDEEALIVEKSVKNNIIEKQMQIKDAVSKAIFDTKSNNIGQVIVYYYDKECIDPYVDLNYYLYSGDEGYTYRKIILILIKLFKLSLSVGIGLLLSHIINGVP